MLETSVIHIAAKKITYFGRNRHALKNWQVPYKQSKTNYPWLMNFLTKPIIQGTLFCFRICLKRRPKVCENTCKVLTYLGNEKCCTYRWYIQGYLFECDQCCNSPSFMDRLSYSNQIEIKAPQYENKGVIKIPGLTVDNFWRAFRI